MKKPSKVVLIVQALFTLVGAAACVVMAKRLFEGGPDLLTILSSIIFILAYVFTLIYATKNYKGDGRFYEITVYSYVALLGIEILYAGELISGFGLGKNVTLLVNLCNLIAFAFTIKFVDVLNDHKRALSYMGIGCALKLAVEAYLIIKMWQYIQVIHIITALAVPILGFTMMVAYMHKYGS